MISMEQAENGLILTHTVGALTGQRTWKTKTACVSLLTNHLSRSQNFGKSGCSFSSWTSANFWLPGRPTARIAR